jgi:hypothetical protein
VARFIQLYHVTCFGVYVSCNLVIFSIPHFDWAMLRYDNYGKAMRASRPDVLTLELFVGFVF